MICTYFKKLVLHISCNYKETWHSAKHKTVYRNLNELLDFFVVGVRMFPKDFGPSIRQSLNATLVKDALWKHLSVKHLHLESAQNFSEQKLLILRFRCMIVIFVNVSKSEWNWDWVFTKNRARNRITASACFISRDVAFLVQYIDEYRLSKSTNVFCWYHCESNVASSHP